tara:strand:+ start:1284 stop:2072 length:789 start_codon:yes stop_codon:yes gene_type:complete
MIIGVQKGGTSSLYHYLSQHPQIIAPENKELHYFDTAANTPKKPYLQMYPKSYLTKKTSFDATPRYIYFPGTAKKIYDFDPNMKFIVVLRDPVKRAFSAWNMYRQMQNDEKRQLQFIAYEQANENEKLHSYLYKEKFPSFEEWSNIELSDAFDANIIEPSIMRRGYYKEQIETYLKYFKLESFLFLDFDSIKFDIKDSLNEVTRFLGISSFRDIDIDLKPKNVRTYNESLSDELYQKLKIHYQEKNKGLEELVNLKFIWMNS